ncbi:hypothetical protein KKI24_22360 [bacterium]|nr:hypothetical protein [bacterium]
MKRNLIILLIAGFLTSCGFGTQSQPRMKTNPQCAEVRLESAFDFHNQAKDFFRSFYKTRKESELFFAWYAAEDSLYMANSIRRCYDKKNKHFNAVSNLYNKNQTLQRLIVQNMRQESQSKLSELYLEDYREIFVRDIQ